MFVPLRGTQTWRLHTKLYEFMWNILSNNLSMECRTDLTLGQMPYLFILYTMSISWLHSWNGFDFLFNGVTVKTENCVTKGKILLFVWGFCWRACFLFPKITSERVLYTRFFWIAPLDKSWFEMFLFSSNVSFVELVRRSLRASPMKPLFTPGGWHKEKCVYSNVSVTW